jgi:hypothetical protein
MCGEGQVGVVGIGQHDEHHSVLCRNSSLVNGGFHARLPYVATMTPANGVGAVHRRLDLQKDNVTYATNAILATHVRNTAVTVGLTGFASTSTRMSSSTYPATLITGLLRSTVVRHDASKCFPSQGGCTGPSVGTTFLLRENVTFGVNFPTAKITVFVNPSEASAGIVNAVNKEFSCSQAICHVSVPLPKEAFLAKLPAGEQTFTVTYRLGGENELMTLPGNVTWVPPPETIADDVVDTAYVVLPSRDLYPGDIFTVEVRSRFNVYFKTAQVRVTVGDGLTITNTEAPTSAFLKAPVDANSQQAVVSLAGRKDGKSSTVRSSITNEMLLTLTVRVDNDIVSGATSTIEIDKLAELTDLNENGLNPTQVGLHESRAGIVADAPAVVHFVRDAPVGVFATVLSTLPTELINTATVSGTAITVPITVTAILVRGATSVATDTKCTSPEPKTLQAGGDDGCTATLDGTETVGARRIDFQVESAAAGTTTIPFRVHQLVHDSTVLSLDRNRLRPYAGLYDESDKTCESLQYQSTEVVTTASFGDASGYVFDALDVSAIARLVPEKKRIVVVGDFAATAMIVRGVAQGNVILQAKGKNGLILATSAVQVTDQSRENVVGLVGLDVAIASGIGAVVGGTSGPYDRQSPVKIEIGAPLQTKLSYEGDTMTVFASAVFEDDSRLLLSTGTGLQLASYNELALIVKGNTVVVPFDPVAADGELLGVSWQPQGACQSSSYALSGYTSHNVTLEVTPPVAEEMQSTAGDEFIVCTNDPAAHAGADYKTGTQLSVSLVFATKTVANLAGDPRTHYTVSNVSLFTADATGKVTANSNGNVGSGTINVTFDGQLVFKVITIVVAKLESITMQLTPHPAYSGSGLVDVTTLSKIGCTDLFEQAKLAFTTALTNGVTKAIRGDLITIELIGNSSNMEVTASSTRIVTAAAAGFQTITAHFGPEGKQMASNSINVTADIVQVTVATINNMKLVAGSTLTTLSGVRDTTAQLQFGVTLSDGRKYTSVFNSAGKSELPGMFTFVSDYDAAISVDNTTGTATLLDNHYEGVKLTASTSVTACGAEAPLVSKSVKVYANLDPVGAGVDVGARTGAPVPAQKKGAEFSVDVRVNTDSKILQAYNVLVAYSEDDLELVKVSNTIASDQGSAEFKPGSSGGNVDLEDVCSMAGLGTSCAVAVASISNSKVNGINNLFRVKFKVKDTTQVAAVTEISGVIVQLLDSSPGGGETIGTKNAVFDAGKVSVQITDGGGGRRRARGGGAAALFHTASSRNRRASSTLPLEKGDANCDGEFDLKDAAFILDYASARGGDFKTSLGELMSSKVEACQAKNGLAATDISFLDPDSNTEVTLLDLTYMLDILAGNFYFMQLSPPADDYCGAKFTVQMSTAQGGAVPDGTRAFLDFTLSTDAEMYSKLLDSIGFVTSDKGALTGGLVEASVSLDDPTLFVVQAGARVSMKNVGLSVIQVSGRAEAMPSWKFFAGKPTTGFATSMYKAELVYSKDLLGSTTDLKLKNGYNPAMFFNESVPDVCSTTSTTTTSATTTSTSTNMPTDVVIFYDADCAGGDSASLSEFAVATTDEIDSKIAIGLWQDTPSAACGSVAVMITAVSAEAAARIRNHVFDSGLTIDVDGETYAAMIDTTTATSSTSTTFTLTSVTATETSITITNTTTTTTSATATSTSVTSTTTSTTTTTTIADPESVDCVETQDECTLACEASGDRNYEEVTASVKTGKACVGPTDCQPGIGGCPTTTSTTTTTVFDPANVDCAEIWDECSYRCESWDQRNYVLINATVKNGKACLGAPNDCQPGEGACPTTSSTTTTTTTITTTTATGTTTTVQDPDNLDCVELQDMCTEACESETERNYEVVVATVKNGRACRGPHTCQPGEGECPLASTTTATFTSATTTTLYDPESKDCEEVQTACTAACEQAGERNYEEVAAAVMNGRACVGATDCTPGDGGCPAATTPTAAAAPPSSATGDSDKQSGKYAPTRPPKTFVDLDGGTNKSVSFESGSGDSEFEEPDTGNTGASKTIGMYSGIGAGALVLLLIAGYILMKPIDELPRIMPEDDPHLHKGDFHHFGSTIITNHSAGNPRIVETGMDEYLDVTEQAGKQSLVLTDVNAAFLDSSSSDPFAISQMRMPSSTGYALQAVDGESEVDVVVGTGVYAMAGTTEYMDSDTDSGSSDDEHNVAYAMAKAGGNASYALAAAGVDATYSMAAPTARSGSPVSIGSNPDTAGGDSAPRTDPGQFFSSPIQPKYVALVWRGV